MRAAVLYKTDDHIDCDRTNIREQIEDILDDPNNLHFKEFTNDENMFSLIHTALGKPTVGITACNVWESKDFLYAGYFVDITELIDHASIKDDDEAKMTENIQKIHKNIKLNMFGSQITSQHVTGNLVIIKKKLSYVVSSNNVKTDAKPDTFTRAELIDVMEKIFVKDGVVIKPDGSMGTYRYIMNPLEHLMLTDSKYAEHYVYHEYEVYTRVMMIIADTREINGSVNATASFLAGKPVNGTVFVAMYKKPDYNENPPHISLSIEILNQILGLRRRSPTLTTGMSSSEKEYVNFEKILELENVKHSDKPLLELSEVMGESLNISIKTDTENK